MSTKKKIIQKLVTVPESGLLSLVAAKLRDRELFPQKVKTARKYLKKVKVSQS